MLGRFFSKPKTKPRGLNEEFSEAMAVKEIAPGSQEAGRVALVFPGQPQCTAHLGVGNAGVQVCMDGGEGLKSPAEGLWSIAMGWQDQWPAAWHHGRPERIERAGEWVVLRGKVQTPEGAWEITDSYRIHKGLLQGIRRFVWQGREAASRCNLSIRFLAPDCGARALLPGIVYHGNPSGARSGRVPVYTGRPGEEAIFEEHRFPMPYCNVEWQAHGTWRAASLHSLPCPAPFGQRKDQWWSMGCVAREQVTELVLLSGPCASNDKRSHIKQHQGGFAPYEEVFLHVPPGGIIEKTFYLQVHPVSREGSGFRAANQASLALFEPCSLNGLPSFKEILLSKYRFSQTRWQDTGRAAGFRMFPDNGAPCFVMGWCGQAEALGYALQVLGRHLGAGNAMEQARKSLDTLSKAKFYESGFHTWYHFEKDEWSHMEVPSQGQAMQHFAKAIRIGRSGGADTRLWEAFLIRACDVHASRILQPCWSPTSTSEGFFIAPLCQAARLFNQPRYLEAARLAGCALAERHLTMNEPYWGGTLDASCEDKEGAYAALQGFLALYQATGEKLFLDWAEHALDVLLTYVCVWDIDLPAGRLRNHAFKTRGWTAVSVQNMHIDAYGVVMTPEIYRMGELLVREDLKLLAQLMFRSCGQIIDPYGSQGEQPQHTNYAQGSNPGDPLFFRGGYNESWTVFWITAHFLNAAAQLYEMGAPILEGMDEKQ